jgi:hypothetical protein
MMLPEATLNELKSLINDTKKLFFGEEKSHKFAMEGTLPDGTKVMIDGDAINVGVPVMVTDADGNTAPIADGEYEVIMEEKYMIVTVGGLITEVKGEQGEAVAPEAVAPESAPAESAPAEQPMGEDMPKVDEEMKVKLASLEERISKLESALGKSEEEKVMAQEEVGKSKQIVIQLQSDVEKLSKSSSDLINIVEKLLNSPASSTTHKPKEKVLSPSVGSTIEEFRKKYMN